MPSVSSDARIPRPSIVVALELLGLDAPDLPEEHLRTVIARFVLHLGAEPGVLEHSTVMIGARALRVAPIKRGGTLLFWELLDLLRLQAELIPLGVHIRGAITLGDAVVQPALTVGRGITMSRADTFLGPGIVEAERLRDTVAEVPRVIVDPRLLAEAEGNGDLRARHHTVEAELGYVRSLLHPDADGIWFIDYLTAFQKTVSDASAYFDFLVDHADLLKRRLASRPSLDREARRWMWLWRYHQRVIRKLKDDRAISPEQWSSLRVPAEGPLFYFFPRSAEEEEA